MQEIIEQRGKTYKVFDADGGKKRFEIHCKPIHYQENGNWEDIDVRLQSVQNTLHNRSDFLSSRNRFTVGFRQDKRPTKFQGIRYRGSRNYQYEITPVQIQIDGSDIPIPARFNSITRVDDYHVEHEIDKDVAIRTQVHEVFTRNAVKVSSASDFKIVEEINLVGFKIKNKKDKNGEYQPDENNRFVFIAIDGEEMWMPKPKMWVEDLSEFVPLESSSAIDHRLYEHNGKLYYEKTPTIKGREWLNEVSCLGTLYIDSTTYYAQTSDGYTYVSGSWSWARTTSTVHAKDNDNTSDSYAIGASSSMGSYSIKRGWFWFDTSGIEDSYDVTAATFSWYNNYLFSSDTLAFSIQKSIQNDTFSNWTSNAFSGNEYGHAKPQAANEYTDITLNSTGLSDISKTGDTKICMRGYDYDYLDVQPGENYYYTGIHWADESGTTKDPKLVITAIATTVLKDITSSYDMYLQDLISVPYDVYIQLLKTGKYDTLLQNALINKNDILLQNEVVSQYSLHVGNVMTAVNDILLQQYISGNSDTLFQVDLQGLYKIIVGSEIQSIYDIIYLASTTMVSKFDILHKKGITGVWDAYQKVEFISDSDTLLQKLVEATNDIHNRSDITGSNGVLQQAAITGINDIHIKETILGMYDYLVRSTITGTNDVLKQIELIGQYNLVYDILQETAVLKYGRAYNEWRYQGDIRIDNPPTLDGYACKITVPYRFGMWEDFRDIRFTDQYGNILPYWIQKQTEGVEAGVWVRVPLNHRMVTMYYGNGSAVSESDGSATFDHFDDFENGFDSSIWDSYIQDLATITYPENGIVRFTCPNENQTYCGLVAKTSYGTNYALMARVRFSSFGLYTSRYPVFGFGADESDSRKFLKDHTTGDDSVIFVDGNYTDNKIRAMYCKNGSGTNILETHTVQDAWQNYEIRRFGTNLAEFSIDDTIYVPETVTVADAVEPVIGVEGKSLTVGSNGIDVSLDCDWIFVRKCQESEPILTFAEFGMNRHYPRVIMSGIVPVRAFIQANYDALQQTEFTGQYNLVVLKELLATFDDLYQSEMTASNDVIVHTLLDAGYGLLVQRFTQGLYDVLLQSDNVADYNIILQKVLESDNDILIQKYVDVISDIIVQREMAGVYDELFQAMITGMNRILLRNEMQGIYNILRYVYKQMSGVYDILQQKMGESSYDIHQHIDVQGQNDIILQRPVTGISDTLIQIDVDSSYDVILKSILTGIDDIIQAVEMEGISNIVVRKLLESKYAIGISPGDLTSSYDIRIRAELEAIYDLVTQIKEMTVMLSDSELMPNAVVDDELLETSSSDSENINVTLEDEDL